MNALICIFLFTYGIYALFNNFKFWIIYILLIGTYYYLTQVKYFQTTITSIRRKVIVALWGDNNDSQVYAKVNLDVTKMKEYLQEKSKETGEKITFTIFVIKLMSIVLKKYPQIFGYIKFGKFNIRDHVDICCLVNVGEGQDLVNAVIEKSDEKDFSTIFSNLNAGVRRLRERKDKEHNTRMNIINLLPTFLVAPIVQATSYLASIGVSVPFLGVKGFEFGSCVITSIGSLGMSDGFPPIPPLTFVPLIVSVCKTKEKYYYDQDHNIKEKTTLGLNFTIDSRFIDPKDAEGLNRDIKLIGENPEVFEREMKKLLNVDSLKKLN